MTEQIANTILDWVKTKNLGGCCFDFGGTLYDFEPVHVLAFEQALGLSQGSVEAEVVREVVHDSLASGLDSVRMASMLRMRFCLNVDPLELAVRKRSIVEHLTATAVLDRNVRDMLVRVIRISRVAVITRGLISSTTSILSRSLPADVARCIPVLGRSDLVGRPDKSALLVAALEIIGVPIEECGYVGDADNDEAIAERVGMFFLPLRPFGGGRWLSS